MCLPVVLLYQEGLILFANVAQVPEPTQWQAESCM